MTSECVISDYCRHPSSPKMDFIFYSGRHTVSGRRASFVWIVAIVAVLTAPSAAAPERRPSTTRRRQAHYEVTSTTSVVADVRWNDADANDCIPVVTGNDDAAAAADYDSKNFDESISSSEETVPDAGGGNGEGNAIEICLGRSREFLNSYLKSLRKQHHQFDKCSHYRDSMACLGPNIKSVKPCRSPSRTSRQVRRRHRVRSVATVSEERPSTTVGKRRKTRQLSPAIDLRDWVPIVDQFERVCGVTANRSKGDVVRQRCVEEELRGALSQRCDEMHKFNIQQKTRHECHFIRERVHCKEALVSSACGPEAGRLAFSVVKLATEKQLSRHGCRITLDSNYNGFRYGNGCARDFLAQVDACTSRQLTEKNVVKFHAENDLVALGTERNLRNLCRVFKRFKQCVDPVQSQCTHGYKLLLDYEGDLRRYILKMDHICDDSVVDVYAGSLLCYQKVMDSGVLGQCDNYWADLTPWLSNMSSYQFYCEPNNANTVNLLSELQKLHLCHADVMSRACGTDASRVMSGLVHEALHDPLYLRLGHRADCSLHRQHSALPSPPPQPIPPESSADDDHNPSPTLADAIVPEEHEIAALASIEEGDKMKTLNSYGSQTVVSVQNPNVDPDTDEHADDPRRTNDIDDEESVLPPGGRSSSMRRSSSISSSGRSVSPPSTFAGCLLISTFIARFQR